MSKIEHGSDKHLMLLAAQHNLNMLTGKDMADLLAFGRSCMKASITIKPLTNDEIDAAFSKHKASIIAAHTGNNSESIRAQRVAITRAIEDAHGIKNMNDQQTLSGALRNLAERFSEGWHEGIKIDATDLVDLSAAANQLEYLSRDAERYRWLLTRTRFHHMTETQDVIWECDMDPDEVDAAIDSHIKAEADSE